jgi:hypothetical protein
MAPSSTPSSQEQSEALQLWKDVAAEATKAAAGDRREADLVRLSSDPILLCRYLQANLKEQQSELQTGSENTPVTCGWWDLARGAAGNFSGNGRPGRAMDYQGSDPRRQPSLAPERFMATDDDISLSLEEHAAPFMTIADSHEERKRFPMMSGVCLLAICLSLAAMVVLKMAVLN